MAQEQDDADNERGEDIGQAKNTEDHRQPKASAPKKRDEDNSGDDDDDTDDDDTNDAEPKKKKKGLLERPILLIVGAVVLIGALVFGVLYWLNARHFQTTDDAFVDTHIVRLAPQVAGRVTKVWVDDNQLVGLNQPIVDIDSADLQTRVAQAQAQKAQAQASVDNARVAIATNQASYQQAQADARAAEAQAINAAKDLNRYRALHALNAAAVAQQQIDQAIAQAAQTAAQRDSALKAARAKADQIAAARTQVASGQEQVRAANAVLQSANINYGYAHLVSPVVGHVVQKTVAEGAYVQPGTQLLAIVPLNIWITANYKETQLALMRVGQHVDIKVDACPKAKIDGHVDSIQRGAGQAFAILPPENATGNYVKVVQRVPVKIVLDHLPKDCPLGPGMSVEPKVRVR